MFEFLIKSTFGHTNFGFYQGFVYDRVRKRKIFFEIPAFLQIEGGKSRAGNSKNQMKTKTFLFLFSIDVLNFPALDFPRSI